MIESILAKISIELLKWIIEKLVAPAVKEGYKRGIIYKNIKNGEVKLAKLKLVTENNDENGYNDIIDDM